MSSRLAAFVIILLRKECGSIVLQPNDLSLSAVANNHFCVPKNFTCLDYKPELGVSFIDLCQMKRC